MDAEICQTCYCCDHELDATNGEEERHLLPCAHLGSETGERLAVASQGGPDGSESADGIVYECNDPRHQQTTDAKCRTCPDYLFPLLTPRTPVAAVQRLMSLAPRPQPEGWWDWPNVQEAYDAAAGQFLRTLPPYPNHYAGRGIVVVGGGRYLPSAYVTVRAIRHVGCSLPIQLWHLNDEVSEPWLEIFRPYQVEFVNADLLRSLHPFRFLDGVTMQCAIGVPVQPKGWQLKPYAVYYSPFREVLALDADSYPVRNPEFLFDHRYFTDSGAIFWPDLTETLNWIHWDAFRVACDHRPPHEAGQLVLNKEQCWPALNLTLWYNAHADFTYRHQYGDKELWHVAFARTASPWAMFRWVPHWTDPAYVHEGPDWEPLFVHRCRSKFSLQASIFPTPQNSSNVRNNALPFESECFGWLEDLKIQVKAGG